MPLHQMCPIRLEILEDDDNGWVGKHEGRGFFIAASYSPEWMTGILMHHETSLKDAGIYDAIWAFKDRFELANQEVMRAIMECFWPTTNTFITPKGKLVFFRREIKATTRLLIVEAVYEEYFPIDNKLDADPEEFMTFFL